MPKPSKTSSWIEFEILLQHFAPVAKPVSDLEQALLYVLDELRNRKSATTGEKLSYKFVPRLDHDNHYQNLRKLIHELSQNESLYNYFKSVLFEEWPDNIACDLNNIDSDFFTTKNKTIEAWIDTNLSSLAENDIKAYHLLGIAILACKFYIERIRMGLQSQLPLSKGTLQAAIDDFQQLKVSGANQSLIFDSVGSVVSDYFTLEYRANCPSSGSLSFIEKTNSPLLLGKIITYINRHTSHAKSFLKTIKHDGIPSDFRPKYLKDLINFLERKGSVDIRRYFNPTGGWGGRLIGTMASPITCYTETDPNPEIYDLKFNIVEMLKSPDESVKAIVNSNQQQIGVSLQKNTVIDGHTMISKRNYHFLQKPVEDLTVKEMCPDGQLYDVVFYSPPYFDRERYADNRDLALQSYTRYPQYEDWLNHFLFKSIDQSYTALKYGGFFGMNIAPIRMGNGKVLDLSNVFKEYMFTRNQPFTAVCELPYGTGHGGSLVYIYQKPAPIIPAISLAPSRPTTIKITPRLDLKRKFCFFEMSVEEKVIEDNERSEHNKLARQNSLGPSINFSI